MPELTFTLRWPDGRQADYYSPSLVVHDHLVTGATYPVADVAARCSAAMREASDRVRATYGMACTSAAETDAAVRAAAARYAPDAPVQVVRLWPPLPPASAGTSPGTTATRNGGRR
ncbi:MAG: MSMEG_0570 family nitrogen starvation response protein [Kineosporiaceae bacterium]